MPDKVEVVDKPFNAAAKDATKVAPSGGSSSEPPAGQPSDDAYRALGLQPPTVEPKKETPPAGTPPSTTPPDPAQAKADAEGKALVDKMSGAIQAHSEELYHTLATRAKNEDGFMDKLLVSKDPVEQRMAKKILERNPEHFGARNPDEYIAKKTVEEAGDDPVKQELAKITLRQTQVEQQVQHERWAQWKAKHGVEENSDLDRVADSVRAEYPAGTPEADIIHVARGRLGITTPLPSTKSGAGMPGGSASGRSEPSQPSTGAMRLMQLDDKIATRAEEYFKQFDA